MKIGIVGHGFVGSSVAFGFSPQTGCDVELRIYDKDKSKSLEGFKSREIRTEVNALRKEEGRNTEIRRICESFDLKVNRLIRISYGPFNLGKINKTEIIEVSYGFLRRKFEKTFFSH